jgi:hypothetical protein
MNATLPCPWPLQAFYAVPRNHGNATSPWLIRAAGAAWRGNREYCGTPGAWGAEPRGQTSSNAALGPFGN